MELCSKLLACVGSYDVFGFLYTSNSARRGSVGSIFWCHEPQSTKHAYPLFGRSLGSPLCAQSVRNFKLNLIFGAAFSLAAGGRDRLSVAYSARKRYRGSQPGQPHSG